MSVWDRSYMESARSDFRQQLGLAGLGPGVVMGGTVSQPSLMFPYAGLGALPPASDAEKRQLEEAVQRAEALAKTDPQAASNAAGAARIQLRNTGDFSSSWSPIALGGWRSRAQLLDAVSRVQNVSLLARGRVSRSAVNPDGSVVVNSGWLEGTSTFVNEAVQAGRREITGEGGLPIWAKAFLGLAGLYLAGKWLEGRGRRW